MGPKKCLSKTDTLRFSPRSPHGCRMFAFRVGRIEVVCAVFHRSAWSDLTLAARPGRTHFVSLEISALRAADPYAIAISRKGVPERHMACRITASFRASATLALRGPVRLAMALAQARKRKPPSFRQRIALAAS